jgi:hypothetical protein
MKKKLWYLPDYRTCWIMAITGILILALINTNFPTAEDIDGIINEELKKFITPSEKFWIHRCNSLEKARLMSEEFAGIEIDANFHPNETAGRKFDIQHDNKESVQITLQDFMPMFAKTNSKIWFDYKNLSSQNAKDSLAELEMLVEKFGVDKRRFIVENHDFKDLKFFHDAGFYTSFYVTVKKDLDNEKFRAEVQEAVASGFIDAVSFPVDYYELVKSACVNADLLTWQTREERWWTFLAEPKLRVIVEDPQVKVILVKMKTPFDRF